MTRKIFDIVLTIVLASFVLNSSAWAACSNSSVTGVYGFVSAGTNSEGAPTANLFQLTFDASTGEFTGAGTVSSDGAIGTDSIAGTYAVAADCTVTANYSVGTISGVVTSTGGVKVVSTNTGANKEGFMVAQGSPKCTNAGIKGDHGLQLAGVFLSGAPFTGPVDLIGELVLSVNKSGDGVIGGEVAGSENGTILTFADEPVTGSYSVSSDCTGTATITPEGQSALNFAFVIVDSGKEMLALETDADTVVTATLQK